MAGLTRCFSVVGGGRDKPSLRIAFATDNGKTVNQHFGTTKSLAIYEINPEGYWLDSIGEFECLNAELDDKLTAKLDFLEGCIAIYCRVCGASAVKKLLQRHIQPLKVVEDSAIEDLIKAFQQELIQGPSSWLAKAIRRQQPIAMNAIETD